jgi:hypothetical protein
MVVKYWRRSSSTVTVAGKPFHGVLLAGRASSVGNAQQDQKAAEEFLKFAEPPAHDNWEGTEALKQNYKSGAISRIKEFWDQATKQLVELIRPDEEGESKEPEHFKKLFDIPGDEPKPRTAKLINQPLRFENGQWTIQGKIKILDRSKHVKATIAVQLVPESGKSTKVSLEQTMIVTALRGEAFEDGDSILIKKGTTSVEFTATCTQTSNLPDMGRCIARMDENYEQISDEYYDQRNDSIGGG